MYDLIKLEVPYEIDMDFKERLMIVNGGHPQYVFHIILPRYKFDIRFTGRRQVFDINQSLYLPRDIINPLNELEKSISGFLEESNVNNYLCNISEDGSRMKIVFKLNIEVKDLAELEKKANHIIYKVAITNEYKNKGASRFVRSELSIASDNLTIEEMRDVIISHFVKKGVIS